MTEAIAIMKLSSDHLLVYRDLEALKRKHPLVVNPLPETVRAGWELCAMTTLDAGETVQVPAWRLGKFAVNPMLHDPGYTVALAASGWRLSFGYKVFRSAEDACRLVEKLDQSHDWDAIYRDDRWPRDLARLFELAHREIPEDAFFKDGIFPV